MTRPVLQYLSPERGFIVPRVLRNLRRAGNATMLAGVLIVICGIVFLKLFHHPVVASGIAAIILGYLLRIAALVATAFVNWMALRRAHRREFEGLR